MTTTAPSKEKGGVVSSTNNHGLTPACDSEDFGATVQPLQSPPLPSLRRSTARYAMQPLQPGAVRVTGMGDPDRHRDGAGDTAENADTGSTDRNGQPPPGSETLLQDSNHYTTTRSSSNLIEAVLVQENNDRNDDSSLVVAEPIEQQYINKRICYRRVAALVALALVMVAAVVTGVMVRRRKDDHHISNAGTADLENTPSPEDLPVRKPTLQRVRERGFLKCGVTVDSFGDYIHRIKGKENWADSRWCKGVAAAIFGADSYRVELIQHSAPERAQAIGNGSVDLLVNGYSRTMERELSVEGFRGFDFSTPYAFVSDTILGERAYVECIEDAFNIIGDICSKVKLCVKDGLRNMDDISLLVPRQHILVLPDESIIVDAFLNQTCNVIIGGHFLEAMVKNYTGDLVVSEQSGPGGIEPLAMAVQVGDPVFLDFVNWVTQALIAAQRYGITKENVRDKVDVQFVTSNVFGEEYQNMFYNAIAAVGNLAEINDNIDPNVYVLPRQNWPIADSTMGVMYAIPFGTTELGVEPRPDGALVAVMNRGYLRCGLKIHELSCFAEATSQFNASMLFYHGMDADFCRAVASGVFGSGDKVEFVELKNDQQGFHFLNQDNIDVFAGATANLENDVRESTTGVGYAFSKPYFYNNTSAFSLIRDSHPNRCLATRQDDNEWLKFVFWIVEATIYAEERLISQQQANKMPIINLYGSVFSRMFRDAIGAVGNYGEIYARNLESCIPRDGLNNLAQFNGSAPLLSYFPGLFTSKR